MTIELLNKANETATEISKLNKTKETVSKVIELVELSITESGNTQFPIVCPLTGKTFRVSSIELKGMYIQTRDRLKSEVWELEQKFNNL